MCLAMLCLVGCLVDQDLYESRRALLSDDDGDGVADVDGDCDDADASVFPGATELCDGRDQDCDGAVDEEPAGEPWFPDADSDGWGADSPVTACAAPGENWVSQGGDCDDADPDVHPEAEERCNDQDDDCDGSTDEDVSADLLDWYLDADGDGWGDDDSVSQSCAAPGESWVAQAGDCDDLDDTVHPEAEEICGNGVDEDCDEDPADCRYSGEVSVDSAGVVIAGEQEGDQLGSAMAWYDDDHLLAGAYGADAGSVDRGTVSLVERENGLSCTFRGEADYGFLGWSLAAGGDFDGDGALDVVAGANNDLDGGRVHVFSGDCAGDESVPLFNLIADVDGAQLGFSVGALYDLDRDGYGDLVAGAPSWSASTAEQGAVALVLGPRDGDLVLDQADLLIQGAEEGGQLGLALDQADLDGDGVRDLVVASPAIASSELAGAVRIFDAAERDVISSADAGATITGPSASVAFGARLLAGQDLDGDGYGDLLVADPMDSELAASAGSLYRLPGPVTGDVDSGGLELVLAADGPDQTLGSALALGDVDGDGRDDLAVGSAGFDEGAGAVALFYGPLVDGEPDAWLAPEATEAGTALLLGQDWDDDGLGDLLVGAPGSDFRAGEVLIVPGVGS